MTLASGLAGAVAVADASVLLLVVLAAPTKQTGQTTSWKKQVREAAKVQSH